jgi:hypothetical protein
MVTPLSIAVVNNLSGGSNEEDTLYNCFGIFDAPATGKLCPGNRDSDQYPQLEYC